MALESSGVARRVTNTLYANGKTGAYYDRGRRFCRKLLTAELLRRGHAVIVLARDTQETSATERVKKSLERASGEAVPTTEKCQVLSADITSPDLNLGPTALKQFGEVEAIWHCAAVSQFNTDNEKIFRTNALGTLHALEFARRIKAKRFYYISTAYVCGNRVGTVFENQLKRARHLRMPTRNPSFEPSI